MCTMLDLSGRQRGNRVPWRKRKGIVAHSTTGRDLSGPRFRWSETLTRLRLHNALVSACDGADLADGFVAVLAGWMVTESSRRSGSVTPAVASRILPGTSRYSRRPSAAWSQGAIPADQRLPFARSESIKERSKARIAHGASHIGAESGPSSLGSRRREAVYRILEVR